MYPDLADCKNALDPLQPLDDEDNYSTDSYRIKSLPDTTCLPVEEKLDKLCLSSETSSIASTTEDMDYALQSLYPLLNEARSTYGELKPPFCVSTPEVLTKVVRLSSNGEIKNITFRPLTKNYGYWVLADQSLGQFIVKCSSSKYYVWAGLNEGLLKEPIAVSCRKGKDKPQEHDSPHQTLTEKDDRNLKKTLRPRTARQSMPYTVYNVQKQHESKGIRLSDADLEEIITKDMSPGKAEVSSNCDMQQAELIANANLSDGVRDTLSSNEFSTIEDCFLSTRRDEIMIEATMDVLDVLIIRTHLHGFDLASIPIVVRRTDLHLNHQMFFELVKKKWDFKLAGRSVAYLVAMFSWLESDKNLLLQESEDGFDFMLREVRGYLMKETMDVIEIKIEVFAA